MRSLIAALVLVASLSFPAGACTNFCMDTPEGPVFGSNLDLFFPGDGLIFVNSRGIAKEGFEPGTTGVTARWISEYGSVTFTVAGREWALGGMNEAGLVIGSMELVRSEFPEPDERPPLPIGPWAQYVLDTCGTVEEAAKVDSKVRIADQATPLHFLMADAKGNCVAIEWIDGDLIVHNGDKLPVKAMTNMQYGRALASYNRGGPRWYWSNPGQSAERFAAAHTRSETFDPARHQDAVKYAFGTLTNVVAAPHTKWNIVYDIAKREIWYRTVESPAVKHLSMKNFDFSCDAPLLMLDINAPLEGDVDQAFIPYDHETNKTVFRTLCERVGIQLTDDIIAGVMHHIESFKCASEKGPAN